MSPEPEARVNPAAAGAAADLPTDHVRRDSTDGLDLPIALNDILAPGRVAPVTSVGDHPTAAATEITLSARRTKTPASPPPRRSAGGHTPGGEATDPAPGTSSTKASVVHIPAPLLPLIAAERQRSGRSNGQILIAAIEEGHGYLTEQHRESSSIGGRLFTARTTKPQLPVAEPLSPLNIRLYEQDFDVLDRLVNELGAGSRSRLATLALAHYLNSSA